MTVDDGTSVAEKPFMELVGSFVTNSVFRKRGEGYLRSSPLMKTFTGEIRKHFAGGNITDNGTYGNLDRNCFSIAAVHIRSLTAGAVGGTITAAVNEAVQILLAGGAFENNVAAIAAVTAVRAAFGNEFFPAETAAAIAAVTALYGNLSFIDKHDFIPFPLSFTISRTESVM